MSLPYFRSNKHSHSQVSRQRALTDPATFAIDSLERRVLFSSGYTFGAIARLGDPAPGPAGLTYTFDFEAGGLNNRGQVIYTADLANGAGNDIGEGVFIAQPGKPTIQLARVGDPAPGGGNYGPFGTLSPDTINNKGDAAFAFTLASPPASTPAVAYAGVFRYSASTGKVTAVETPDVTPVPGGGTFAGAGFHPTLNDHGDLVFPGVIHTTLGTYPATGLGVGLYLADKLGTIHTLVAPGSAAPGGKTFDFAQNPTLDNRGDVGFEAHLTGEAKLGPANYEGSGLGTYDSAYLKDGRTGAITSIAHQGQAIPASAGGSGYFDIAFGPIVNDDGQVLFDAPIGATPAATTAQVDGDPRGLFLWQHGRITAVVRPGQLMPGGGHLANVSYNVANYDIDEDGKVVFNAVLDTGAEGVWTWFRGHLALVAKTGDAAPGGGTLDQFDFAYGYPAGYVLSNDRGQIAFGATLKGGGGVLALASPRGDADGEHGHFESDGHDLFGGHKHDDLWD